MNLQLKEWLKPIRAMSVEKPLRIYMGNEAGDLDSGFRTFRFFTLLIRSLKIDKFIF